MRWPALVLLLEMADPLQLTLQLTHPLPVHNSDHLLLFGQFDLKLVQKGHLGVCELPQLAYFT